MRHVIPKVSVIIPVYNVEAYLRQCLDSVVNQTLKDIEIICVDDGSTDRSYEILKSYAACDGRIKILKSDHKGAYRAREMALAVANGEFLHMMDSDDIIDLCAYEECYKLCVSESLDHLIFTTESFVSDGDGDSRLKRLRNSFDVYYHLDCHICGKVMSGRDLMGKMMKTGRFFVGPPLRFVRMSLIKKEAFPSPNAFYHGDNYYSAVWLYVAERAMAIDRRFYKRRVHGSSITTAKGKEQVHFQSILNVIVALCRVAPFREKAIEQDSIERVYLQELVNSLACRSKDVSLKFQCDALLAVEPPLAPDMQAFMVACFLPMFTMMRNASGGNCMIDPWRRGMSGANPLLKRAWACYRENGFVYTLRKLLWAIKTL